MHKSQQVICIENCIRLESVDSTNKYLAGLMRNSKLTEGTILLTDNQIQGRGQGNNSWESSPGKNLTFSILLYPDFINIDDQFMISKLISLGLTDFVSDGLDNVTIKWPNDIYVGNRKIAGILIENSVIGDKISSMIVGIGLNINQTEFLSDAPNPVSLSMLYSTAFNLSDCLTKICNALDLRYKQLLSGQTDLINKTYVDQLYRVNEFHDYICNGDLFNGKITGVDNYGRLCIITDSGEEKIFSFGEVEFII